MNEVDGMPIPEENMDAVTKKTEDIVQPDESIYALDNHSILTKSHMRNPFN